MIILDTDILSIAERPSSPEAIVLQRRIIAVPSSEVVASTVVNYEEQMRGWLDYCKGAKTKEQVINAYQKLFAHLRDWRKINVVPFDQSASDILDRLRSLKIRVGSYDLKIGAIALAHGATLITRNVRDFGRIPGLLVEGWTKE